MYLLIYLPIKNQEFILIPSIPIHYRRTFLPHTFPYLYLFSLIVRNLALSAQAFNTQKVLSEFLTHATKAVNSLTCQADCSLSFLEEKVRVE